MEAMVFSNTLSILVNRCPTAKIQVSRGLRQGGPHSPFLFILATEGLPDMVMNDVRLEIMKVFLLMKAFIFSSMQMIPSC